MGVYKPPVGVYKPPVGACSNKPPPPTIAYKAPLGSYKASLGTYKTPDAAAATASAAATAASAYPPPTVLVSPDPALPTICFYVAASPIYEKDRYGSEIAVENLSRALSARGYNVFVASDACARRVRGGDGVFHIPSVELATSRFEVVVVSRFVDYFVRFDAAAVAGRTFLWLHDVHFHSEWATAGRVIAGEPQGPPGQQQLPTAPVRFPEDGRALVRNVDRLIDGYVALCPWHKDTLVAKYGLAPSKVHVIGNAAATAGIPGVLGVPPVSPKAAPGFDRVPGRFVWISDQCRGLRELVLEFFPRLLRKMPHAHLEIYRDLDPIIVDRLRELPFVRLMGMRTNAEVVEGLGRADYWLYPTNWPETYCISALEAQAAGALVIATDLAALSTTVGDRGVLVRSRRIYSEEYWTEVLDAIEAFERDPALKAATRARAAAWAREQTWDNAAAEWKAMVRTWA